MFAVVASGIPAYIFLSRFFSVDASVLLINIVLFLVSASLHCSDSYLHCYSCSLLQQACCRRIRTCYGEKVWLSFFFYCRKRYDEKLDDEAGKKEASAYAMFITNLVFEGCVLLLAFVVLPRLSVNIPSYVVYSLVTGIAGAFTFGFSYKYI